MATVALAQEKLHGRIIVTWDGLGADDDGTPFEPPVGYRPVGVQLLNHDTGSVEFQGALESVSGPFAALGTASTTDEFLDTDNLAGRARWYRPAVVGGSDTDIKVLVLFAEGS